MTFSRIFKRFQFVKKNFSSETTSTCEQRCAQNASANNNFYRAQLAEVILNDLAIKYYHRDAKETHLRPQGPWTVKV